MSYYSAVVYNITSKNPNQPIDRDNTDIIISYSQKYHTDIKNFLVQHAEIEQLGGECLQKVLLIYDLMDNKDNATLAKIMHDIADSIKKSTKVLGRFSAHVKRAKFLEFRKFFKGTGDPTLFPNGITFEEVNMKPIQWGNANGGQSGLLQVFDRLISTKHTAESSAFLNDNLRTLPQAHRNFLAMIEKHSLFNYVAQSHDDKLKVAFERIIEALGKFRLKHFDVVSHYLPDLPEKPKKILQDLIQATQKRIIQFASSWQSLQNWISLCTRRIYLSLLFIYNLFRI